MSNNTVAVVHGKSEAEFCRELEKATRCRILIYSKNDAEECIQLRDLPEVMSGLPFTSVRELHARFPELDYKAGEEPAIPGLTIFTIVDTDDSPREKQSYITGNLLSGCPLSEAIVPLYNDPNMDAVFMAHGMPIDLHHKVRSFRSIMKSIDLLELHKVLKADQSTNLDLIVCHALSRMPEMQGKIECEG